MLEHLTTGERTHLRSLLAHILDDERITPEVADYIRQAFRDKLE
ncbi:hypothetical protein ACQP25_17030 [Microtetraspora malaysiensis]